MPHSQNSQTTIVHAQPAWNFHSNLVSASVTEAGGHVGPVTFQLDGVPIQPFSVAPWAEETPDFELPPLLSSLRGDFFCLPFGNNAEIYQGEAHPYHGETANSDWKFESITSDSGKTQLHLSLDMQARTGHVDKYLTLIDGQTALYSQHVIRNMNGPMDFGHHAMLKFPNSPGSGVISTSPFIYGQVLLFPAEEPEKKGYSFLKPGALFTTLESVPALNGEMTDLSRYPARRGYEDLAMIVSDPNLPFAWTAVTFAEQGYVWFALKDPQVLRNTLFWISNGGRHYAPWNGRHVNVMGLEEVTSYFHCGLAASANENVLSQQGYPTHVHLEANQPYAVNYIMAVVKIPTGFDVVKSIVSNAAGDAVTLQAASGQQVTTKIDMKFLHTTPPPQ